MPPAKRKAKRPAKKSAGKNLIMWARLPKGASIEARGPKSRQLETLLKNAGLNPEAACFGGDTCIV